MQAESIRAVRRALLPMLLLAACADDPTAVAPVVTPPAPAPKVLGVVEITFSGLGTAKVRATATPVSVNTAGGASRSLSVAPYGGLQLGEITASTVDIGARGAGGQRYLEAVFQVRNASPAGVANSVALNNLMFVPVSTTRTIAGTPVGRFHKMDGTPAGDALATQLIPAGAVAANGLGGISALYPDVLQVLSEAEVASIEAPEAVTNRFPYAFVVRRVGSTTTRQLPANPAPGQFDGAVTLSYRFPLQATPAADPFTVSVVTLVVQDSQTRITQSPEEQTGAGKTAFESRAQSLNADVVRLLPGGSYSGAKPTETLCGVRTAGTVASPTVFLGGPCAP